MSGMNGFISQQQGNPSLVSATNTNGLANADGASQMAQTTSNNQNLGLAATLQQQQQQLAQLSGLGALTGLGGSIGGTMGGFGGLGLAGLSNLGVGGLANLGLGGVLGQSGMVSAGSSGLAPENKQLVDLQTQLVQQQLEEVRLQRLLTLMQLQQMQAQQSSQNQVNQGTAADAQQNQNQNALASLLPMAGAGLGNLGGLGLGGMGMGVLAPGGNPLLQAQLQQGHILQASGTPASTPSTVNKPADPMLLDGTADASYSPQEPTEDAEPLTEQNVQGVGDVPGAASHSEVESAFARHGRLIEVHEIPNRGPRPVKAFFITYADRASGARAMQGRTIIKGRVVHVGVNKRFETGREWDREDSRSPSPPPRARSPTPPPARNNGRQPLPPQQVPPVNQPVTVTLSQLPSDVTAADLSSEFGRHVEVLNVWRDEAGKGAVVVANWEGGMAARRDIQARELFGPHAKIYVRPAGRGGSRNDDHDYESPQGGGGRGGGWAGGPRGRMSRDDSWRDRPESRSPSPVRRHGNGDSGNSTSGHQLSTQASTLEDARAARAGPTPNRGATTQFDAEDDDPRANSSLYVAFFPADISRHAIWEVFERFGRLDYIRLVQAKNTPELVYAFVNFEHLEAAKKARREMDGRKLFGMNDPIKCNYGKGGSKRDRRSDDPAVLTREAREAYMLDMSRDEKGADEAKTAVGSREMNRAPSRNDGSAGPRRTDESFDNVGSDERTRILHIWNLSPTTTDRDFLSFLGPLVSSLVKYKLRYSKDYDQSHAYGVFRDKSSARAALDRIQDGESEARCGYAFCSSASVRCTGLPAGWLKKTKLKDEFGRFGTIESVVLKEEDKEATVEFEETEDAKRAVLELRKNGDFNIKIMDDFTQGEIEDRQETSLGGTARHRGSGRDTKEAEYSGRRLVTDNMDVDVDRPDSTSSGKSVYDLDIAYEGSLALKNREVQFQLFHVAGNKALLSLMPSSEPIKLVQRFKLGEVAKNDLIGKMHGVSKSKGKSMPTWALGVAVAKGSGGAAAGVSAAETLAYFVDYFKEKECAGVTQERLSGPDGGEVSISWMPNVDVTLEVAKEASGGRFANLKELAGGRDAIPHLVLFSSSGSITRN
ncbi:hypothetical protein HDU93_004828 [Gonapodya sp. JEL0774]|nr:hypothetical protein HDU93_004828 [Gonapodya sp. JEL0774]